MSREGNQQPNLLPFGKSIDSLKLTEYQPVADDQQTDQGAGAPFRGLVRFAFLELWAGLPRLLLELEMVLPSDSFSPSALNLAVFQPVCPAFYPNGLRFQVNGCSFHLRTLGMPGYLRPAIIYDDYKSCI